MTPPALSALLLAIAIATSPGRAIATARLTALRPESARSSGRRRSRPGPPTTRLLPPLAAIASALLVAVVGSGPRGIVLGPVVGFGVLMGSRWLLRRFPTVTTPRARAPDPFQLASGWDLLAACLRGGLPVPVAVRAIAAELPEPAARPLLRTAELLAFGADPVAAWEPALDEPLTAELARGARRTARSGAALAGVAENLAVAVRANADDEAESRAQRAAVAVAGPLGLCFLPAFLCIGVVPVVIGLASRMLASW